MLTKTLKFAAIAAALGAMSSTSLAGPLGIADKVSVQPGDIERVAFVFDGRFVISAIEGLVFVPQQDAQGNIILIDPNGVPWGPVFCCATQQVDTAVIVGGTFATNAYGPVYVYDGGFNFLFSFQQ